MLSAILMQNHAVQNGRKGRVSEAKYLWLKWGIAAACVCLIAFGAGMLLRNRAQNAGGQQWTASMRAKDYFKNSGKGKAPDSGEASIVMPPYAVQVLMSDDRSVLEAQGILPEMRNHPDQSFSAEYNGDGSLYKVSFWWMRRGEHGIDEYSDLIMTAAPRELHEVTDTISSQMDSNGDILPEYITATIRDGITIYAAGQEHMEKTLTWQTDEGWYRITGSFHDSYEDMIVLLDWFWEHPLHLARFSTPPDGTLESFSRGEQPDAFAGQIPGFTASGYTAEKELIHTGDVFGKNVPVWFDGEYIRGETRIRWTVSTGADRDAWADCLGRPGEITEEKIRSALSGKNCFHVFLDIDRIYDVPYMAELTLEQGTPEDVWELIQTLAQKPDRL